MDARTKIKMMADCFNDDGKFIIQRIMTKSVDIVKTSLREIKNFGGKDINKIDDSIINQIPIMIINEMATFIINKNFNIEEAERKN